MMLIQYSHMKFSKIKRINFKKKEKLFTRNLLNIFTNIDNLAQTGHHEMQSSLSNIRKNEYSQFFSPVVRSLFHFLSILPQQSQEVVTIPPLFFAVIKQLLQEYFSRLRRKEQDIKVCKLYLAKAKHKSTLFGKSLQMHLVSY